MTMIKKVKGQSSVQLSKEVDRVWKECLKIRGIVMVMKTMTTLNYHSVL